MAGLQKSKMKTSVKEVINIFSIAIGEIIKRDDRERWIGAIMGLTDFPRNEIDKEFEEIVKREGFGKPPLYYLEGVRRRLLEFDHEQKKKQPVAQSIKDILRKMAL